MRKPLLFVIGLVFAVSASFPVAAKPSHFKRDQTQKEAAEVALINSDAESADFLDVGQDDTMDTMVEAAEIAVLNARKRSARRCWRAVKNALLVAGAVSSRPTTRLAKQAGDELEQKFGFKRLAVEDPFDAPIGAVLVYGGRGGGHVEFRTAEGFVSDFTCLHPSRRPLIGVYVKA